MVRLYPLFHTPRFAASSLQFVNQPNYALVVTIKNQPYNSLWSLYYTVRVKDHNSGNVSWRYPLAQLIPVRNQTVGALDADFPKQTADSDYTNISIVSQSSLFLLCGQNDVQVAALQGETYPDPVYAYMPHFYGATSGWSSTQTITIPAGYISNPTYTRTPIQTVNPPPTVPEFDCTFSLLIIVLILFSTAFLVSKLVYKYVLPNSRSYFGSACGFLLNQPAI
ncbi:MAG: hypothetical protein M1167_05895 [Chloroflexi bacterium]|nr:hypothetical protein [Chloroflexota bacterium]